MLPQLPSEIIYHIAIYLPTASSLANLSQTCKRLHSVIAADDSRIYRALVQGQFPSIETPPFWIDAARALTSRSRALDRAAAITRVVIPYGSHQDQRSRAVRTDRPTIGYRPVIDSYERWTGETWAEREEILVWGAGSELLIQRKHRGKQQRKRDNESWSQIQLSTSERENGDVPRSNEDVTLASFNDLQINNSWHDICSVHLLKAEQTHGFNDGREDVILGRRNGDLSRMLISHDGKSFELKKSYKTGARNLERTDVSSGPKPVLAATADRKFITLFHACGEETETAVEPFASLETAPVASKLLCDDTLAAGIGVPNSLSIFHIGQDMVVKTRDIEVDKDIAEENFLGSNRHPNTITPLPATSQTGGRPGDLILVGCTSSQTRLYDLRSRNPHAATFIDTVDTSPVYSIHPFGRDHFAVGSGQDAIVKLFDMRMPGIATYSYLNASPSQGHKPTGKTLKNGYPLSYSGKNISIFLSHQVIRNRVHHVRYRGPVYALTSPSPSSSTLYAGVENNLVRLDFASTDDLSGPWGSWYNDNLDLDLDLSGKRNDNVLSVSCYERPQMGEQRGMKLLMQEDMSTELRGENANDVLDGVVRPEWDRRWRHPPRGE
ncbi:hypothetical protein FQN54_005627 [Arachnomyces sp. PD_36]|nr:hypothetical protein FQN54_005627 [Arachnomyces sp. PD_36]